MKKDEGSLVLGSRNFQAKTKRDRHATIVKEISESFIDSNNKELKKELLKKRNCPLCKKSPKNSQILFVKDGFYYRKCKSCMLVYVSPVLKDEVLKKAYAESEYSKSWMEVLLTPIEQRFNQPKFDRGIMEIERICGSKGKILDVGCAVGQFLLAAKNSGWEAIGLELNKKGYKYCESLDFEVVNKPLTDNLFPPETFDAVSMWEVLEHVPYPREIIKCIYKILKPNGVLLIVVPNRDALAARVLQEKCNLFFGMGHINMFNNHTLSNLLKEENYNISHCSTFTSEISVINNYLNYEHPYFGECQEIHPLFSVLTEEYILKNLLGYKLKIIARK